MSATFEIRIPRQDTEELTHTLKCGDVCYILGSNGSGKSSLISRLFSNNQQVAKRIAAHRQNWIHSNTLDMTPRGRDNIEQNIRSQDAQNHSRYRLEYAHERTGLAIFDLIDADTMLARKISDYVRSGRIDAAKEEAKLPAPLAVINDLMRQSNLPIEISIEERERIVARKRGGPPYSVAELSDGERNAFLIAADVLTAKPGTLLLIDEPERHLHKSIISPLLSQLFENRRDCSFIVSTHDVSLPIASPEASTILVRDCEYDGSSVRTWTADLLPSSYPIDDALKTDILGSRQHIVFTEGTLTSLDVPLYAAIYPQTSILPKQSCKDVEQAVKGLQAADELHWVRAFGIVDNDQRTQEEISRLELSSIFPTPFYSVEAIYYHPETIRAVATRQTTVFGGDEAAMTQSAIGVAIDAVIKKRSHLIDSAVLRTVRRHFLTYLPKDRATIADQQTISINLPISAERTTESSLFDGLATARDWEGLITRYPVRESSALDRIAEQLKFANRKDYQAAVVKLVHDDENTKTRIRSYFPKLTAAILGSNIPTVAST